MEHHILLPLADSIGLTKRARKNQEQCLLTIYIVLPNELALSEYLLFVSKPVKNLEAVS
ncbi:hypothetical protein SETIT_8G080700v2 [Setaria italica]|uniref:Uncharacterized protein n=1 Tax=Setaria italica TaxID=4555 RepID=A0A368S5K9_SETIT|nr:hypothetical protein SETIT_8G080700v2 [Setaria italica]